MRDFGTSLGLAVAVLFGAATASIADPLLTERFDYYDIKGDSAETLLRSIKAMRGNLQRHGHTSWKVEWQLGWSGSAGNCRLSEHEVAVDVVYRLPRWRGMTESDNPQLVKRWQTYDKALRLHERGHCAIAVEAAEAVENAFATMTPKENCDRLVDHANARATDILERHKQRELDYDQVTAHGATQGAVFP